MNKTLFSLAAAAAASLLPLTAQAQVTLAQDNAGASAYSGGYDGKNSGTGFGAFSVVANPGTGYAGTFVATASESEGGNGTPAPGTIDTGGVSFGTYANGNNATPVVTVSRGFNVGPTAGDTFSLDFVTGYNDGANATGSSGAALTNALGTVGSFAYQSNNQYLFNGTAITGQNYVSGALHLSYDFTSATSYTLAVTGPFSFTGSGTFTGPITGFQVQQANSNNGGGDHNAYFNNLLETAPSTAPVPEASSTVSLGLLLALGLGGFAVARKRAATA